MKTVTKAAHSIVRACGQESLVASAGAHNRTLNKLIPLPEEYTKGTYKTIKRDGVRFRVDLSNYMQWCLFSNQPDRSWKFAVESLRRGAVILDVGANVGHFSLKVGMTAFQKVDVDIYAFEPNPLTFLLLQQNLNLNSQLLPSIQTKQLALGDIGSMNFTYNPVNTGAGHLVRSPTGLQVKVARLDDWFKETELPRIDFIKMDVEGYEPKVLLGASEIISAFRPVLYLEITDEWFRNINYSANWIFHRLGALGYQLFVDGDRGMEKLDRVAVLAKRFNLLAVQENADHVGH
jgi:FkbM family methyltransferase